ncbi:MAG: hypothetical protein KF847_12575 [Pirellulales bacterium]|nr:hypothetical protein [Pirellulales bacterium]
MTTSGISHVAATASEAPAAETVSVECGKGFFMVEKPDQGLGAERTNKQFSRKSLDAYTLVKADGLSQ